MNLLKQLSILASCFIFAACSDSSSTTSASTEAHSSQATSTAPANLVEKLLSSAKEGSSKVIQEISNDLNTKVQSLAESIPAKEEIQEQLKSSLTALANGEELEAVKLYKKISTVGLTPAQTKQLSDLKNLVSAYALESNFSGNSDVSSIVSALRSGDLSATAVPLQKVISEVKLTPEQSALVDEMVSEYAPQLKELQGKAKEVGNAIEGVKKLF